MKLNLMKIDETDRNLKLMKLNLMKIDEDQKLKLMKIDETAECQHLQMHVCKQRLRPTVVLPVHLEHRGQSLVGFIRPSKFAAEVVDKAPGSRIATCQSTGMHHRQNERQQFPDKNKICKHC